MVTRQPTAVTEKVTEPEIKADIEHVLKIMESLPILRRYGDDEKALKEVREILGRVMEKL